MHRASVLQKGMSIIYIDQMNGADAGVHGTIDQHQTLAYAIFSTAGTAEGTQHQIRKGPEYDAPTKSATKKTKKGAQGLEEKRLKARADERYVRERQEKRYKRLEEGKKIDLICFRRQ